MWSTLGKHRLNCCNKTLKTFSKEGDFIAEEVEICFGDNVNIPHGIIDAMLLSCIGISPPICILTTCDKLQFCHLVTASLKTPTTFGVDSGRLKSKLNIFRIT